MSVAAKNINGKGYSIVSTLIIISIVLAAKKTGLWVITAIPVGFLFGFFLKKGELCGASAISEVILMKDRSKAFGLWVAIVVSMVLFAIFDLMGIIKLSPKPLIYLNYIVGGVLFGTGIVLAGGCISGCLFKSASGNINSMAGLVGIPLGISIVEFGYLNGLQKYMNGFVLKSQDGGPVTLSTLTGMPYWLLSAIFAVLTIIGIIISNKRNKKQSSIMQDDTGIISRTIRRPWKPWKAGIAIGILALFAYLSSAPTGRNYPLGVTHGVLHMQQFFTESNPVYVYKKPDVTTPSLVQKQASGQGSAIEKSMPAPPPAGKKINLWLLFLVLSLMIGSWVSGRISGTLECIPRPPSQTLVSFIGGILLGAGAAFAGGCVIGNILSGWALMSVGNILFGVVTILCNWAVTYFYLMGGNISDLLSKE